MSSRANPDAFGPVVLKFGGTSVGSAKAMEAAAELVRAALPRSPLVVLSAMSGITNSLVDAAKAARDGRDDGLQRLKAHIRRQHLDAAVELLGPRSLAPLEAELEQIFSELDVLLSGVRLLRELSPRSSDAICSLGERLSTRIFAAHLQASGIETHRVDARAVVRTDSRFGAARPDEAALQSLAQAHLEPHLVPGRAVVTEGYIGSDAHGITTTLGRGGSDYSAALLGAAIGAREVQIWTDVEGILTGDPRLVPDPRPVPLLSFAEAAELAAFGAKVLHPATIQPAVEANIPVTVRHTRRPEGAFTTIRGDVHSSRPVSALAARGPVTVITVHSSRMLAQSGFLARLFEVFGRLEVSVDLVATAEVSVSLTVEPDAPIEALRAELERFAKVSVAPERAIVALVGERMRRTPGVAAVAFEALKDLEVEMISMGANEINLSLVVAAKDMGPAMARLHQALFPAPAKVLR